MTGPAAAEVVRLWDGWSDASLPARALALLELGGIDADPDVTIAERDRRLLEIRQRLFGPTMEVVVTCSQCDENLTFDVACEDLASSLPDAPAGGLLSAEAQGWHFVFRLPSASDLCEVARDGVRGARAALIERCVVEVAHDGEPADRALLASEVGQVFAEALEATVPGLEHSFVVTCVECGHRWTALFDIVAYLWSEVAQLAREALWDVHELATAYGWSEDQVLRLSSRRRSAYLDMVR